MKKCLIYDLVGEYNYLNGLTNSLLRSQFIVFLRKNSFNKLELDVVTFISLFQIQISFVRYIFLGAGKIVLS